MDKNVSNYADQVISKMTTFIDEMHFNTEEKKYAKIETLKEITHTMRNVAEHWDIDMLLEECDKSYKERKERKDKFIHLVNEKIDKMTDEQIDKFIEWFEELQ